MSLDVQLDSVGGFCWDFGFRSDSNFLLGVERECCPLNDYPSRLDWQKVVCCLTTGKTASADSVVYHGVELDDGDQGVSFVLPFERRGHYATRESWWPKLTQITKSNPISLFDQIFALFGIWLVWTILCNWKQKGEPTRGLFWLLITQEKQQLFPVERSPTGN